MKSIQQTKQQPERTIRSPLWLACCAVAAVIVLFLAVHKSEIQIKSAPSERSISSSEPRLARTEFSTPLEPPISATRADVSEWQRRLADLSIEPDSDVLSEIAATIPEDRIPETLEHLATGRFGNAGVALGRLLIQQWATNAVTEAATWAAHLPDGDFGRMICEEIANVWPETDLAAATAWVQQLPANGNKTSAQLSLSIAAARSEDVTAAIKLASDAPLSAERDEALQFSARQWAISDPNAAASWVEKIPDAALRDETLAAIATDLAVRDPFRAAEFLASASLDEKLQNKTVLTVVRFWASSTPARAADWVAKFPESPLQEGAMKNLIDVWARNDFASAGEWLMHQPDSPARTSALASYQSTPTE